jgi:hypothetical protein
MTSRVVIAVAIATVALSMHARAQAPAATNTVSCARHEVGARTSHSLAYDARAQRVMMFGGVSSDSANRMPGSLWAWDGHRWQCVSNDGPPVRGDAFLAYDVGRSRLVLFGGRVFEENRRIRFLYDTWEWDGTRWTRADTAGPAPRVHGAIAYDAARKTVVMHAGGGADSILTDTWEWNGTRWRQIPITMPAQGIGDALLPSTRGLEVLIVVSDSSPGCPSGSRGSLFLIQGDAAVPTAPSGPCVSPMAPATAAPNGFILYTGWNLDEPATTWIWESSRWQRASSAPPRRRGTAMAYDEARRRVVLFGGGTDREILGDTWEWDGKEWTRIGP